MRVVVLGAGGLLGHKMFQLLSQRYPDTWATLRTTRGNFADEIRDLFPCDRTVEELDVADLPAVDRLLRHLRPEAVVNCVGVVKQRPEASDPAMTIAVNSLLPHRLASVLSEWGGRLIHFSTDCVFSGRRGQYRETDQPDGDDLYGCSKRLGEPTGCRSLTLRTSFIGRELTRHRSLLDWFLRHDHDTVDGYRRVWWSGLTSSCLATLTGELLSSSTELTGLYHVAGERLSKYDLLTQLRDGLGLDIEVLPRDEPVCDRSLRSDRFRQEARLSIPSWASMIDDLRNDPTPYPQLPKMSEGA